MTRTIEKTGVVAELDGKYWGTQYEDGHSTSHDYGKIEKAEVSDPKYCPVPTHMTWSPQPGRHNYDYDKLEKATLRKITITTTYEVEGVEDQS